MKKAIRVGDVFITDPAASPKEQVESIKKYKFKKYKNLSKIEQQDRMRAALDSGANEVREFISKLAKEYSVPVVEFSFWLLQQESYVDFEDAEFSVKERD